MRSIGRVTRLGAVALAAAALVGACSSGTTPAPTAAPSVAPPSAAPSEAAPSAAPSAAKPLTIGSMIWNTSVGFYANFIKGQQDTAKSLGVTLDLQNGNGDLATEVAVIQQFIAKKVDLIIVTPSDAEGIVPAIKQANDAGIPVISANNKVGDAGKVVTFVGADDYMFGQKQGELLVKAVGEKGNVGYIMGKLGTSAQVLRKQGLDDYLKNHAGIKLIESQAADWDNAKALALVQDWLSKYPAGKIDAIIDQGPEGGTAAKYAFDNGRKDVKFLMGDYPKDVKDGIAAGYIYGTVDQDPKPQGEQSVQLAVYWLNGQKDKVPQPTDYLDLPIVTKDNVDQYPAAWGG